MPVFVDDMYKAAMGRFRHMKMSHMVATDVEELHAMAERIGVARRWFQGDHYDVAMSKRAAAIAAGAVPVTMYQLSAMRIIERRWGVVIEDPVACEQMWKIWVWMKHGTK